MAAQNAPGFGRTTLGLGWRLCRDWSTDYWQDPHAQVLRIEQQIADATAEVVDEPMPADVPPVDAGLDFAALGETYLAREAA